MPVSKGMEALAAMRSRDLQFASIVAGGGRAKGVEFAFLGVFRVDNPTTSTPADTAVGFAVEVVGVTRDARTPVDPSDELYPLIQRKWPLKDYLDAPGAVRWGDLIRRRKVIEYFRNYRGGVHNDLFTGSKGKKHERQEFIHAINDKVIADMWTGLQFELLSIGQSIGRSEDMLTLSGRLQAG
jgi:hypothetical protein